MRPGASVLEGQFVIEREVASGGMGRVFRAREQATGAPAAVKILRNDDEGDIVDVARFTREISVLSGLAHPGIVRYLAHGRSPMGQQVLVEEWIEGRSLREVMAEDGLTVAEAVAVSLQLVEALQVVHAQGIVHRDVKPGNLLFRDGRLDRLTLIDFGIALRTTSDSDVRLTLTGNAVGTPGYMSPEQARGDEEVDARADLFATGCLLYECLTARPAFGGDSRGAIHTKLLLVDPVPARALIGEVPLALDQLVLRLLAKDRERRPADAAEVARELASLRDLPDAIRRPTDGEEPPTRRERPRGDSTASTRRTGRLTRP